MSIGIYDDNSSLRIVVPSLYGNIISGTYYLPKDDIKIKTVGQTLVINCRKDKYKFDFSDVSTPSTVDISTLASTVNGYIVIAVGGSGSEGKTDVENTSSTILTNGSTYTGTAVDVSAYASVTIAVKTDQSGIAYMEFSPDATNWYSSLSFNVEADVNEVHRLSVTRKYFRGRFTNNSGSDQTYFSFQTILGTQNALTSALNSSIQDDTDTVISRSILTGEDPGNNFRQVGTTVEGKLIVSVEEPLSAFGELMVSNLTPYFQISPIYDQINPTMYQEFSATGGTITADTSKILLNVSTSIGSYAVVRSKRRVHYKPGMGAGIRFAGYFNTGVENLYQTIGMATSGNGFSVGYNGLNFGILRASGGLSEVRKLTITTAAGGTESLTITLNGVDTTFNVTATTTGFLAHQIAAEDYSAAGFYANHIDSTVIFTSINIGAKASSFTITNNSGGGTAAGSFTTVKTGVAKTDTWVTQPNFNIDTLDGTGPSGFTINQQLGNVYEITYQWLGYGAITYKVENPMTGKFFPFHRIRYANTSTNLHVQIPTFPFEGTCASLGSTTEATVAVGSVCGFIQGPIIRKEPKYSHQRTVNVSAGTTSILTIQNRRTFRGINNQSEIFLQKLSIATDLAKVASFKFILNATIGSDILADYDKSMYVNEDYSIALYDETATTSSGGTSIFDVSLGKTDSIVIDINSLDIALEPTDSFTISVTTTGAGGDVSISLSWIEDH